MEWFSDNWFFVLLLILFIAMHMFGHGHGGHGGGGHGGGSHRGHGGCGGTHGGGKHDGHGEGREDDEATPPQQQTAHRHH